MDQPKTSGRGCARYMSARGQPSRLTRSLVVPQHRRFSRPLPVQSGGVPWVIVAGGQVAFDGVEQQASALSRPGGQMLHEITGDQAVEVESGAGTLRDGVGAIRILHEVEGLA